ncbi:hypothetical protein H6P81_002592 [Aristolochia fimbriata]|uniref:Uncharacterized protein n=1 Tax=Aristolochia fimbriata TaxID=158543 RepID=A0AAV7FAS1_ARIFI|nr:hypothetical protein H6P81_002592 [Aristolochia fimbriata]
MAGNPECIQEQRQSVQHDPNGFRRPTALAYSSCNSAVTDLVPAATTAVEPPPPPPPTRKRPREYFSLGKDLSSQFQQLQLEIDQFIAQHTTHRRINSGRSQIRKKNKWKWELLITQLKEPRRACPSFLKSTDPRKRRRSGNWLRQAKLFWEEEGWNGEW